MYWFDTVGTIPDGVGFSHFDLVHLLWLLFGVALTAVLCAAYTRASNRVRRILRLTVGTLILLDEAFKWFTLLVGGNASVSYLPFHLCSINILLIAVHMFKPTKLIDNFLYLICIPAAIAALLFPTWTELPPTSLMHIHSFTVHILLAAYPLMLTIGGDIRPTLRQLPYCLLILIGMAAAVYGINVLLDTNFMFLMDADKGNPLYWFKQAWGNHLLGFPVLLPAVFGVMYGIYYAVKAIRKKASR
ncbi:MAG: hypothetical protein E7553_05255 [Ruminococcaceae bacterium]|nr:hypothetical protein [Oscillospiraceae bacterium]